MVTTFNTGSRRPETGRSRRQGRELVPSLSLRPDHAKSPVGTRLSGAETCEFEGFVDLSAHGGGYDGVKAVAGLIPAITSATVNA